MYEYRILDFDNLSNFELYMKESQQSALYCVKMLPNIYIIYYYTWVIANPISLISRSSIRFEKYQYNIDNFRGLSRNSDFF